MLPSAGDEPLKSLPQPRGKVWGHLEGILLYQVFEGLDSCRRGTLGGHVPIALWTPRLLGGRAQLGKDQSRALYGVQSRVRPLSPRPTEELEAFRH